MPDATTNLSVFEQCEILRTGNEFAVLKQDRFEVLILTVKNPDRNAEFFYLTFGSNGADQQYWLWQWRGSDRPMANILPASADVPEWARVAINEGVPLPKDSALFAWLQGGVAYALAQISSDAADTQIDQPSWSVMPLVGSAVRPPFTGDTLAEGWNSELLDTGELVDLAPHIRGTTGVVAWLPLEPDSSIIAVRTALPLGAGGSILGPGVFAYYRDIDAGRPLPSVDQVFADTNHVDLGTRF